MAASGSGVAFPSSDSPTRNTHYPRPTYLPFRRISLPTAPSLMHRQSVASVASFDSLPEEDTAPRSPVPAFMRNVNGGRKVRPGSTELPKRGLRRKESSFKPVDAGSEAKRRKIVQEFYETERAYVDGLELIYSHFLTPIIGSLDTPQPLLDRPVLTSVFSNFIDIWNLHRSLFSSLTSLLFSEGSSSMSDEPLSPTLLSHFPYLSLYTPFVTAFPATISSLTSFISPPTATRPNPHYNFAFATFLAQQEADPRCGKLKLRDWLLTVVQRCPRYLLLLRDLIDCTSPEDNESAQLTAVHILVSKITLSLNTSLHTHAQTLSLLALQRATPNLPFQLIEPGRTLLKRGPLLQIERSDQPREREFLLFSDCLIWLASEDSERGWKTDWGIGRSGWTSSPNKENDSNNTSNNSSNNDLLKVNDSTGRPLSRPGMVRSRSKSEAELSMLKARSAVDLVKSTPASPVKSRSVIPPRRSHYHAPQASNMIKRHAKTASNGGVEERWVFKGRAELVDLEVVVTPPREAGEERRWEVLSPEGSFVLFGDTEEERDEWCSSIRQAKSQLLISLNITHPNSTLTSSSSTNHLRRTLQALPFPASDERLMSVRSRRDAKSRKRKGKKSADEKERRGWVEHWVPAIWIPDEKAEGCMRCGRSFGWRRRRHHCRLCGRCVCATCSERTFFVADPNVKEDSSKPARACNACYETVFPLLDQPVDELGPGLSPETNSSTINSIANFPSWLSMPSLPLTSTPEALMAIDREPQKRENRRSSLPVIDDDDHGHDVADPSVEKRGPIRLKSPSRPRSYLQILEDFEDRERVQLDVNSPVQEGETEGEEEGETESYLTTEGDQSSTSSSKRNTIEFGASPPTRVEDTVRRHKRFSMPAVALQTTSVMARTQQVRFAGAGAGAGDGERGAAGRSKRFSLVLGRHHAGGGRVMQSESGEMGKGRHEVDDRAKADLGQGVAAGKLSELLGKKRVEI